MRLQLNESYRYLRTAIMPNSKKGGIMKRQIVLTGLVSLILAISSVNGMQSIKFIVDYNSGHVHPYKYANKDIREFHAFQEDVRDFSEAVYRDKTVKARRIKSDILRRIRNEIDDTRTKIRYIEHDLGYNELKPILHNKKRSGRNEYSKRNSNQLTGVQKHLKILHKQLSDQKRILIRLDRMNLSHGYDFHTQARIHLDLMYEFEKILKKDINKSYKQYRKRNRVGD